MELALRRSWGLPFGMRGLGQDTTDATDTYSTLIDQGVDPADAAAYLGTTYSATLTPAEIAAITSQPVASVALIPPAGGTLYTQLIAQGVQPADAAAYIATGATAVPTVSSPVGTTLSPTLCSDGSAPFSDGSCTQTSAPAGSQGNIAALAQVAAALTKAVAPTVSAVGGIPTCPAGFVYGAPGASVSISPGVATVGTGKCLPSTTTTGVGASLIAGLSNTTLLVGVLIFAAVMMATGSKRR